MVEYFDNTSFMRSAPENKITAGNSIHQTILNISLAIGAGIVIGFCVGSFIQRKKNKKLILNLQSENHKLKNDKI